MSLKRLPVQSTTFIGRQPEIAEIADMLAQDDCRLVTIVGAGGMGKTRMAIAIAEHMAEQYPDGVFFVDLVTIRNISGIVTATANALGFQLFDEDVNPIEQLLQYLRDKRLLLVLDNFEHLLAEVEIVDDLLTLAENIKIIVTSREPLNLDWEWLYQLRGMQVPDTETVETIRPFSALQLFEERAKRTQRQFDLYNELPCVIRLCQLVEGMPLGIELATAWVNRMSCSQLADEIQKNLDILTSRSRNTPDRHRSIRAVFDYSWSLLSEDERSTLVKLSVFGGAFTQEAAEYVAGASVWILSSLVDRSLVRFDQQSRYSLHPLMEQYLADLLASDTDVLAETQARHAQYYYEWLIENIPNIYHGGFFDDILQELDNIIQTWQWLVDSDNVRELEEIYWIYAELTNHAGNRIVMAENVYAYAKRHFETQADDKQSARILAVAQVLLASSLSGGLFWHTPEHTELMRQAYDLAHYSGDPITIVIVGSHYDHKDDTSYAQNVVLVEQMPRIPLVAYALYRGYLIQQWINRYDLPYEDAVKPIQRLLEAAKQAGFASLLTRAYKLTAFLQLDRGYMEEAEQSFLKALEMASRSGHNEELYWGQSGLRWVYTHLDRYQEALDCNEKCLELARQRNHLDGIRQYYQCLAINYRHMGDLEKSIDVFRKNVDHIKTYAVSHIDSANTHSELAWTYAQANRFDLAQQHVDIAIEHVIQGTTDAESEQWATGFTGGIAAEILLTSGMIAMHNGHIKQAVEWFAIGRNWTVDKQHTHLLKKVKIAVPLLEKRFEGRNVIDLLDNVTDLTLEAAFAQLSGHEGELGTPLVETLSERELDVLALLAEGASNRDIARELFITLGTVKRHVHNITGKLSVENRTQAALKAKELGLV